jgi:hypothetical protein
VIQAPTQGRLGWQAATASLGTGVALQMWYFAQSLRPALRIVDGSARPKPNSASIAESALGSGAVSRQITGGVSANSRVLLPLSVGNNKEFVLMGK